MSKLKKILVVLMVTIIVLIHVSSYAVIALVNNSKIQISDFSTAENGNITTNVSDYELFYQWIEIDNNTYNQIKKLRNELQIIQYYNTYITTFDNLDHDLYESAQEAYKAQYGDYFSDINDLRVDTNESQIISLLPNYNENWTKSTNDQYSIDLSTFEGVKDFVLWVKLAETNGTISYNAEIFELNGTKQTAEPTPEVTPTQVVTPTPTTTENDTQANGNIGTSTDILDPYNNIEILEVSTNGIGTVNIYALSNYTLFYGNEEISEDLYNQIKQLEDELKIIEYFNTYEATHNQLDYDMYVSAQEYYHSQYGEYIYDGTELRVDTIESIRNSLLLTKQYTGEWSSSVNNSNKNFFIDGSTYTGTKYFISWVKLVKENGEIVLDGEIQKLIGSKGTNPDVTPTPSTTPEVTPTPSVIPNADILDPYNNIIIHDAIDGKGTIEVVAINKPYDLYYQWVEIDENLYNQIKKIEDELEIISLFNIYEATGEQEDYNNYIVAQEAFYAKYGEYIYDGTELRVDTLESIRDSLLLSKKYGNNWIRTEDNTYEMDLSKFDGTKYYILWAKLVKPDGTEIYDGEVFKFTGTKKDEVKPTPTTTPEVTPTPTTTPDVTPTPTTTPDVTPTPSTTPDVTPTPTTTPDVTPTPTSTEDGKKDDTTTNGSNTKNVITTDTKASGKLPQTGIDGNNIAIISAILGLSAVSVVSFIKYRKIK